MDESVKRVMQAVHALKKGSICSYLLDRKRERKPGSDVWVQMPSIWRCKGRSDQVNPGTQHRKSDSSKIAHSPLAGRRWCRHRQRIRQVRMALDLVMLRKHLTTPHSRQP